MQTPPEDDDPPLSSAAAATLDVTRMASERTKLKTRFIELPPTLRGDGLTVKAELVAPVLAVEGPDDVLLVGLDDVGLGLFARDLRARDRRVELISLGGRDVDQDLRAVAEV